MKKQSFNWTLSHTKSLSEPPCDRIDARVPGAVQLDYANAFGYSPYYYGLNFKQFAWTEDEYFIYDTVLDFNCKDTDAATLCFDGIDYAYEIFLGGERVYRGEGMFTPVRIDVSAYKNRKTDLRVVISPIPKCVPAPQNRGQAKNSCKPASSYGWDWHPRLVPSGIWREAYLEILPKSAPYALEASYRLNEELTKVNISATVKTHGEACVHASLITPQGDEACGKDITVGESGEAEFELCLDSPELWYPRGYGEQPIYILRVSGTGEVFERKLGFRRSRLVKNEGWQTFEKSFPMGPIGVPMTIEINGKRIFAKGSNWVNTEIFPSLATDERYDELLKLAYDANMNILRMWGGQFINHEHFYDRCDELGILVWQEFMLSCNVHPDSDGYLEVLEQEATTIIKRLRTHPCLAFWCGGNELFNSWSGLDVQSHPLRLLDSLCFELDRFTPFNMTSPLHGVGHGSYVKVQFPTEERLAGNYKNGEEFLCSVKRSACTAYTEFGCNAASPKEYILKYIMDEKTYNDCNGENKTWVSHHAFNAWNELCWFGMPEVEYYFGAYSDVDDCIEKSIYLQDLCYKSMFEEMRRQPQCSMAINWDFNEPWPCAAGNSLVNWPAEPKSCLSAVGEALRPSLLSLCTEKNRYLTGEKLNGDAWLLNDSDDELRNIVADVFLIADGERTQIATLGPLSANARENTRGDSFELDILAELPERFSIELACREHPELCSVYNFVHNKLFLLADSKGGQVESNDFSEFMK